MTTITEFITARLDAKAWSAQAAKDAAQKRTHYRASMIEHCDRELREVAAMRAILAMWSDPDVARHPRAHGYANGVDDEEAGRAVAIDQAVRHLAAIDGDHPDYLPEWAPETAGAR